LNIVLPCSSRSQEGCSYALRIIPPEPTQQLAYTHVAIMGHYIYTIKSLYLTNLEHYKPNILTRAQWSTESNVKWRVKHCNEEMEDKFSYWGL